jgi:hypothetical protein
MKKQRLIIADDELIELKIGLRNVKRKPENVGCNFGDVHITNPPRCKAKETGNEDQGK